MPADSKSDRQQTLFHDPEEINEEGVPAEVVAQEEQLAEEAAVGEAVLAPGEVPSLVGKTVYVLDANNLIFQVFHAIPEMTSPRGEPVNAVYGFIRDIYYLLEDKRPDYLFCAFDVSGDTYRHGLFAEYKQQRAETPKDLSPQFGMIKEVLEAFSIPVLGIPSYEADDILATLARLTEAAGGECYLVTGDKDCRQLITDCVKVYNIRRNELYDRERLREEWGVTPEQVVDFQALVGDAVDNVPGVPLIGPKIARELLETFGSLDAVLERADEIKQKKRRENLIAHKEQALLSRQLVRLNADVPVELDWGDAAVGGVDRERLLELFQGYGFRTFTDKVRQSPGEAAAEEVPWETNYQAVTTSEQLRDLVEKLQQQTLISIDSETTHVWPMWAEIVGISVAWEPGVAYYLPLAAPAGEPVLDRQEALEALRPILEDATIQKVGQNLKYEVIVFHQAGITLRGVAFDTMVASYLLEAGARNHNLDELAQRYLNHTNTKISELIGTGKNQKRMDEVPLEQVVHYACEDADVPLRLMPILREQLEQTGLWQLFQEVEIPLISVLAQLEINGISLDVEHLRRLSVQYTEELARLEQEIYREADGEFNIASPKQLQKILFEKLNLPILKRTRTGPSTDAEVLEELARNYPLPALISQYRGFAKLKNTYVDALPAMVHPQTARVHTSFNQVVAATGRLSSSDPNLQNIPIRTEGGRLIRAAFRPCAADWSLIAADYSQIELRVLAHFSGDEALRAAFERDDDIHAIVASQVFGVPLDEVTSEMRRTAKAVNFGVIYGQSPFGLAKTLGIEQSEAAEFITAYFDGYPGVEQFLTELLADCRTRGYVTTILGRRRAIRGVRPDAGRQRNLAERTAINTVIQGSAADLIKLAMNSIGARLPDEGLAARPLLQIHDELVFEAPATEVDPLAALIESEMTGVMTLDVPLRVDVKVGSNWAEVEPR